MQILITLAILNLTIALSSLAQKNQSEKSFFNKNNITNQTNAWIKLNNNKEMRSTDSYILTKIRIIAELANKKNYTKGKEISNKDLNKLYINEIVLTNIKNNNISLVSATSKINENIIKSSKQNAYIESMFDSKNLKNGIPLRTKLQNKTNKVLAIKSSPKVTNRKSKDKKYILNETTTHKNKNNKNYNTIPNKKDYFSSDSIMKKPKINNEKNNIKSKKTIEIKINGIDLLSEIETIKLNPLILSIRRKEKNLLNNKNDEKTKIETQNMKLNKFISKNPDTFSNKKLIQITQAAKKLINYMEN
ncbi:flagellar basal body P-ring protein FlgI [Borrelia coriaceae]|nr:flagellar basal body P-ring protein FlgI [Borrelia coriaceae]